MPRRCGPLVAGILAGCGWAADQPPPIPLDIDARGTEYRLIDGRWVFSVVDGFVGRQGDRTLVGTALRYEPDSDRLFVTGDPVLVLPGMRIEAAHLGADGLLQRGEAWDVRLFVPGPRAVIRISAAHLRFAPGLIVLRDVRVDSGHGGLLRIRAARIEIGLADPPIAHRVGAEAHLTHIAITHAAVRIGPLPVFYSPWLYRDFRLDYPWTRFEVGESRRQGPWLRAWTRFDLGGADGWHLRSLLRLDHYHRVGTAIGVRPLWKLGRLGEGQGLFFGFDEETVRRTGHHPALGERSAWLGDVEHRVSFPGGAGYARFTDLPPADPGLPPDERFRADHLRPDLEERPFARRGVTLAWSGAGVGLGLAHELPAQDAAPGLERELDALLVLPALNLLGPLRFAATVQASDLTDQVDDEAARRLRGDARFGLRHWHPGGISWEIGAGGWLLAYDEVHSGGTAQPDSSRSAPQLDATLDWRLDGRFASGLRHRLTPRLALQWLSEGSGDPLPAVAFDRQDRVEEDLLLTVTALDTDLSAPSGRRFRARLTARWALREEDAPQPDPSGLGDRLHDLAVDLAGAPIASWELGARGTWSGRTRTWADFDADTRWYPHPRIVLSGLVNWREREDSWQYQPGIAWHSGRYQLSCTLTWEDDDRWNGSDRLRRVVIGVGRHMVDGDLTLTYDWFRSEDDDSEEYGVGIAFSLDPFTLR